MKKNELNRLSKTKDIKKWNIPTLFERSFTSSLINISSGNKNQKQTKIIKKKPRSKSKTDLISNNTSILSNEYNIKNSMISEIVQKKQDKIVKEYIIPDVFLGGSCNPTTWRKDIAIPLLNKSNISFYNPQVDDWYPELVDIEAKAKELAKIVFFVIDNQTRSIVCINEAIEYMCRHRRVFLVIKMIEKHTFIDGKELSQNEIDDLNNARNYLIHVAEKYKNSTLYFSDVKIAINKIIYTLENTKINSFTMKSPRLRKRSSILLNIWSKQFNQSKKNSTYDYNLNDLNENIKDKNNSEMISTNSNNNKSKMYHKICNHLNDYLSDSEINYNRKRKQSNINNKKNKKKEEIAIHSNEKIYQQSILLDGVIENKIINWREKIAVPLFRRARIPFHYPIHTINKELNKNISSISISDDSNKDKIDKTELILFVIPANTRTVSWMGKVIENICSNKPMILVIEKIVENTFIENKNEVTEREYKDLCRARSYLEETAKRNDIEVYSSIKVAVCSIIKRIIPTYPLN